MAYRENAPLLGLSQTLTQFMNRQHYIFLGIFALAALIGFIYDTHSSSVNNINRYINAIENRLHESEKAVEDFFDEKEFVKRQLNTPTNAVQQQESDFDFLKQYSAQKFTIAIYQKDSLVFWTNNQALPLPEFIEDQSPVKQQKLVKLGNGYYELIYQTFKQPGIERYTACGMIPIKYEFELSSEYLKSGFVASKNIPVNIQVVNSESDYPVNTRKGDVLCYLQATENLVDKFDLTVLLLFYFIAFLFLAFLINDWAKMIGKKYVSWQGAAFLIIVVFGLRYLSIHFGFTERFSAFHLFDSNFKTHFSRSLGDLLINIVLLLWVMIFFHKEFKVNSFEHLSQRTKLGLTTLNYFSILAGILFLTSVFKSLVFDTGITFEFDNVFNLSKYSLLAIIGVILLLLALFLFSHRMMLSINKIGLTRNQRLACLTVAAIVSFPLMVKGGLLLPNIYLILIAFVFILIFDLFIDSNIINFTWLVIWLIILSAFPSILLFKYNAHKDRITRFSYARELADLRDSIAENSFLKLKEDLIKDPVLINEVKKPFPFKIDESKIKNRINKFFTSDNYLFYNYTYNVFG